MRFYFKHRLFFDYTLGFIAALSVKLQLAPFGEIFQWPADAAFQTFSLTIAASSATLLGFVLAANTFLISHTQHHRLSMLRRSGGFTQLIDIMKSSLWRLLILTIYAGAVSLIILPFEKAALEILMFILTLNVISLSSLIWATMSVLAIPLD